MCFLFLKNYILKHMLKFWLCFLSFFYTVNSFSTEEKQEEEIKCKICNNTIIKIEKEITKNKKEENNEENYTVKESFASLSCIFDCECNSYFLCKSCYEKKMDKCPKCKNNKKQSKKNTNNDYRGLNCNICTKTYINIELASCSYFYNCDCKGFICKGCYETWVEKEEKEEHKCPICKSGNDNNGINYVIKKGTLPRATMGEIKDQKNCCQICTEYIKDFFIDC